MKKIISIAILLSLALLLVVPVSAEELNNLSDEELNRRNSRLQREKQYRDLTEPPIRKETRQIGRIRPQRRRPEPRDCPLC